MANGNKVNMQKLEVLILIKQQNRDMSMQKVVRNCRHAQIQLIRTVRMLEMNTENILLVPYFIIIKINYEIEYLQGKRNDRCACTRTNLSCPFEYRHRCTCKRKFENNKNATK